MGGSTSSQMESRLESGALLHSALANVADPKQLSQLSQLLFARGQQSAPHSTAATSVSPDSGATLLPSQQEPAELESWLNAADVVSNVLRSARQHYSLALERFAVGDPSQHSSQGIAHAHVPHHSAVAGLGQCATTTAQACPPQPPAAFQVRGQDSLGMSFPATTSARRMGSVHLL